MSAVESETVEFCSGINKPGHEAQNSPTFIVVGGPIRKASDLFTGSAGSNLKRDSD